VLTASNAREDVLGALRAGATGYLTKEGTPDGLIRALRGVRRGEAPINRTLAAYLVEEVRLETRRRELLAKVPDREHLTPRQLEVLRLLAAGSSTERIASELYLSVETVRWHVKSILRKLRVSSRAEAIACLEELRAS
jgi:two-component system response regulator DevR